MNQISMFDQPAPPTRGPATTPEARREYARNAWCQTCGAAISDEWLLASFGYECRACEELRMNDGAER